MFKIIPLGGKRGGVALVDRADAELVLQRNWFHDDRGYARSDSPDYGMRMHALLMGGRTDHKNGNKLDNRRSNLRLLSQQHNCQNVRTSKGDYRGVYFDKRRGKFYGQVKHNGKKYLTPYTSEREVARKAVQALRAKILPYSAT